MSDQEIIIELLNKIPEYRLCHVKDYLQEIIDEETADETLCQKMIEEYMSDTDPEKRQLYSLRDLKKEWGL